MTALVLGDQLTRQVGPVAERDGELAAVRERAATLRERFRETGTARPETGLDAFEAE